MSKKKVSRELVTETFTWFEYEIVDPTALGELLIPLSPASSGLGAFSGQITNFVDMYRFARIDDITVEYMMDLNASTSYTAWFLAYLPPGATAPNNLLAVETMHVSKLASGNVANAKNSAVLHMTRKDLMPLAEAGGPGPGWLATASDGPTNSWGDIYIVNCVPVGSSANVSITGKVTITMSFHELVDPTLISLRIKSRNGRPERQRKKLQAPKKEKCDDDEDLSMSRLKAQLKALSSK